MAAKKQRFSLIFRGCFVVCLLLQAGFAFARGLDKYLESQPMAVGRIRFIPVTLRDGMESRTTPLWPLKDPSRIFQSPVYARNKEHAPKAGIDLKEELDKYSTIGYKNNFFFLLFYNFITASGCPNDYVIQRTKIRKLYYDFSGIQYKDQRQFLVEAIKLTPRLEIPKADEHRKAYSLGGAARRKIIIDSEIGCGNIFDVIEEKPWPYGRGKMYHRIQDYSKKPGLYKEVDFIFSHKYRITMEFERDGKYSFELPNIPQ